MSKKIKIVFFGTSEFALPALKKLASNKDIEIALVVTKPDKQAGRGMNLQASPVKEAAKKIALKISQPEKVKDILNELGNIKPDLIILAAYGKLIPDEVLAVPKFGSINIHPSLLPKFRGPSPIESTILDGATETGVTIMEMVKEMDAGPIVAQTKVELKGDEIGTELNSALAEIGAAVLLEVLFDYTEGKIAPIEQDSEKATFTKLFTQEDREINQNDEPEINLRKIRAFADKPGAWMMKDGKRLKIFEAYIENNQLVPTEIQWEGKTRQKADIKSFINE